MIRQGMFISDRYEIIDKVGSGGMSDVYKAKDHKLGRFVAIKVLKAEFSEDTGFLSKFKAEAQSAAGLAHPNIVNVHDVGEDQGIYYIVMELIEGITLKKYIEKKGKLPVKEAVSIAIQVAQGIEAAHNNHIIHRDIKPQNIMISREGKVKVTDFGIARAASSHTINGNAMGSVHYISPEQAKGGYIDEKSDIYSLGITMYEMITGQVPFEGESTVAVALQHINEEMPNPKDIVEDLPVSVQRIIEKCTQKKPERRYLKVSTLIADLKKSLITPNEDFVQMTPMASSGTTVVISEDEVSVIKEAAEGTEGTSGINDDFDDIDDEKDDVFNNDDDIDSVNPKMDNMITIVGVVGAIIVGIFVILLVVKMLGGCGADTKDKEEKTTTTKVITDVTISDKQTLVPNCVGKTEDDAIEMLSKASLGYKIERRHDDQYPKGYVIEQSEEEDAVVDKNSTIKLVVSEGAESLKVPDVVTYNVDDAKEELEGEKYGFIVNIEYEINEEVEVNKVIRTKPAANASLNRGGEVTLYVSQGSDTSDVVVPNLADKKLADAESELSELGLKIEVQKEVYSDTVEKGRIINQNRAAGKTIPRGEVIGVVVSKGKEPESTTQEPTTTTAKSKATIPPIRFASLSSQIRPTIPANITDAEGNSIDFTGTISAEAKYTVDGGTMTMNLSLTSSVFNSSWSQDKMTLEKEVASGTEVTVTYTIKYTDYVDGVAEEKTGTHTYTTYFN